MQQVLEPKAFERLGNIRAVKPEKAVKLENIIFGNINGGKVQGKITEAMLIDLMHDMGEEEQKAAGEAVTFKRTKFDDSDEIDYDNLDL